jgi:glutaminyl-tRNA synthetase
VFELHCSYDPESRGGGTADNRKVEGTLHWVSAQHAVDAEVRLFDRLFVAEDPNKTEAGKDYMSNLNPSSLEVLSGCKIEPSLRDAPIGGQYQFLRQGYFCVDLDSKKGKVVFNRAVGLKDSWSKIEKKK